jgi:hypothetical protein
MCEVALFWFIVLNNTPHWIFNNLFYEQKLWKNLRLNSQLNGKNHQPTFDDLVCDENHFKKINTNPFLFVEVKLKYFNIYVRSHYQTE